jgi:outer membrane protein insertion porin family
MLLSLFCSVTDVLAARKGTESLDVDRIELSGIRSLDPKQVEGALEISPGDEYQSSKLLRSAANLRGLYRLRGYEDVKIRTRLIRKKSGKTDYEDVLEFEVEEGLPTRVARVVLVPDGISEGSSKSYWEINIAAISAKVGVFPGDILDQEKLAAARRTVKDLLASREYVGAQAEDIRTEATEPPKGMESSPANRWVKVEFRVRPGDRVSFGFRGNSVFSSTQLLALVDDQRTLGFGKDYVASIRNRIEDEYRSLGYGLVNVETYTFEKPSKQERHVTYEIHEGPRLKLQEVEFDGNDAFSSEELRKRFYAQAAPLLQQGYYSETDAKKAAEQVIEWMKTQGYLSAKLVTLNSSILPRVQVGQTYRNIKLKIYVYEWEHTVFRKIQIQGAKALPIEEIKKTLKAEEGASVNLSAFSEGIEALKALYRSKGYLGIRILNEEASDDVVKYYQDNRLADVDLQLFEGPCYRASKVIIEGLKATREYVVRREIPIHEGDVIEEGKVTETEARLRKLGIFSSVSVRHTDDPAKEGHKIIRIALEEGSPGLVNGGIGFRNDLGIRVFSGIAYTNLWGENHTLAFDATVNRRLNETYPGFAEFQTQVAYIWPWFLEKEINFRPTFTVTERSYFLFNAVSAAAAAIWEKRLTSHLTGTFSYTLERVRQFDAKRFQEDNQLVTIGTISPAIRLDYRDHPLAPTSGFYGTASFEYAAPWLLSQVEGLPVGYTRFQLRGDCFIPVTNGITWYLSLRTGIARNLEPVQYDPQTGQKIKLSGAVPPIKQFTLGGAGSLRGFKEQALNSEGITIHGTQTYVNYRTQLDLPISGNLRFGPFLDAANLQVDTYSFDQMRYGAGFGFHYQTPVGPVNLDVGFNLDPRHDPDPLKDEDFYQLYFTVGVI